MAKFGAGGLSFTVFKTGFEQSNAFIDLCISLTLEHIPAGHIELLE